MDSSNGIGALLAALREKHEEDLQGLDRSGFLMVLFSSLVKEHTPTKDLVLRLCKRTASCRFYSGLDERLGQLESTAGHLQSVLCAAPLASEHAPAQSGCQSDSGDVPRGGETDALLPETFKVSKVRTARGPGARAICEAQETHLPPPAERSPSEEASPRKIREVIFKRFNMDI